MNATYRIVIEGVKDGFTKELVVSQLAPLFKVTEEKIHSQLDAPLFVAKTGIDLQSTEKYLAALEQRGCVCIIEPEAEPLSLSIPPDASTEPAPLQQSSEVKSDGTMNCKKCGADIEDASKFCDKCGHALFQELSCAKCGKTLKPESKYCSECGSKIQETVNEKYPPPHINENVDINEELQQLVEFGASTSVKQPNDYSKEFLFFESYFARFKKTFSSLYSPLYHSAVDEQFSKLDEAYQDYDVEKQEHSINEWQNFASTILSSFTFGDLVSRIQERSDHVAKSLLENYQEGLNAIFKEKEDVAHLSDRYRLSSDLKAEQLRKISSAISWKFNTAILKARESDQKRDWLWSHYGNYVQLTSNDTGIGTEAKFFASGALAVANPLIGVPLLYAAWVGDSEKKKQNQLFIDNYGQKWDEFLSMIESLRQEIIDATNNAIEYQLAKTEEILYKGFLSVLRETAATGHPIDNFFKWIKEDLPQLEEVERNIGVEQAYTEETSSQPHPDGTARKSHRLVKLHTNYGDITMELDTENAPESVNNFIKFVVDGFYDGTIFHRVIKGQAIEGGDYGPGWTKRTYTKPKIIEQANGAEEYDDEDNDLKIQKYGVTFGGSSPSFHIKLTHEDECCVSSNFGKVVDGKDVVDFISEVKTHNGSYGYWATPVEEVIIIKAEIVE